MHILHFYSDAFFYIHKESKILKLKPIFQSLKNLRLFVARFILLGKRHFPEIDYTNIVSAPMQWCERTINGQQKPIQRVHQKDF